MAVWAVRYRGQRGPAARAGRARAAGSRPSGEAAAEARRALLAQARSLGQELPTLEDICSPGGARQARADDFSTSRRKVLAGGVLEFPERDPCDLSDVRQVARWLARDHQRDLAEGRAQAKARARNAAG